ncbi:MAG: hypothetical protein LC776_10190 [Acidobacteria bacterium]|nr:hypothetical protein [Acidobacteriota bacterium]
MVEATDEHEAYLLVPRGMIFKTDTYVPLDAVVKRAGTDVFINIPKLVVGEMPWTEPPSRAGRRAKLGPPAAEVDELYGSRSPSAYTRASAARADRSAAPVSEVKPAISSGKRPIE